MQEHIIFEYTKPKNRLLIVSYSLASLALGIFFFYWILSIILPVIGIEIQYQYKKTMRDVFHVTSMKNLVLPMFRFDIQVNTYDVNGLYIPKIFVDEPVLYNIDPNDIRAYNEALKKGIAHASSTGFPGTGVLGYYFAHSANPALVRQYNAVFYLLGKLDIGDDIYLWHNGTKFRYRVIKKVITSASDVSFITQKYQKETIVLQTCWPPGTTLQRLLVFAEVSE